MGFQLPPLASLRLFEAAARLRSFKTAADELGVTPSAVSHGIAGLEDWLGTPLFVRDGRRLSLTQAGEDFLPHIAEGLSMIASGTRRISPWQGERRVHVSVAPSFARLWLLPRLPGFRGLKTGIRLHVDTSHRQAVLPLDGMDAAIRMGTGPWPASHSELLFREALLPVASPRYARSVAGHGALDWASLPLIRVTSVEHDWDTWLLSRGLEIPPNAALHVDVVHLALQAAAVGLGVALCRLPLCTDTCKDLGLQPLTATPVEIPTGYWLTVPSGREPRREVDAFCRWVRDEASQATSLSE